MRLTIALIGDSQKHPKIFQHLWRMRSVADAHDRIARSLTALCGVIERLLVRLDLASPDDAPALAFVALHAGDGIVNAFGNRPEGIDPRRLGEIDMHMVRGALDGTRDRRA